VIGIVVRRTVGRPRSSSITRNDVGRFSAAGRGHSEFVA
jgi:hypothetical protein